MDIEQRIEALEISDRRKSLLTLALVLNAALILAVVISLVRPGGKAAAAQSAGDLKAERVIIVDGQGRPRIVLGSVRGVVGVFHVDEHDNPRLITGVNAEGKAAVRMYDEDGRLRYECATNPDGDVESLFYKLDDLGEPVPTYKLP
ncbi:MAG: hypothetical protein GC159_15995 [Phycisphaera sp.]|nr:hypothetical protein [Phycisphaera sp.]